MPRRDVDLDYLNVRVVVLVGADSLVARVELVLNVVFHLRLVLVFQGAKERGGNGEQHTVRCCLHGLLYLSGLYLPYIIQIVELVLVE